MLDVDARGRCIELTPTTHTGDGEGCRGQLGMFAQQKSNTMVMSSSAHTSAQLLTDFGSNLGAPGWSHGSPGDRRPCSDNNMSINRTHSFCSLYQTCFRWGQQPETMEYSPSKNWGDATPSQRQSAPIPAQISRLRVGTTLVIFLGSKISPNH